MLQVAGAQFIGPFFLMRSLQVSRRLTSPKQPHQRNAERISDFLREVGEWTVVSSAQRKHTAETGFVSQWVVQLFFLGMRKRAVAASIAVAHKAHLFIGSKKFNSRAKLWAAKRQIKYGPSRVGARLNGKNSHRTPANTKHTPYSEVKQLASKSDVLNYLRHYAEGREGSQVKKVVRISPLPRKAV